MQKKIGKQETRPNTYKKNRKATTKYGKRNKRTNTKESVYEQTTMTRSIEWTRKRFELLVFSFFFSGLFFSLAQDKWVEIVNKAVCHKDATGWITMNQHKTMKQIGSVYFFRQRCQRQRRHSNREKNDDDNDGSDDDDDSGGGGGIDDRRQPKKNWLSY